MNWTIIVSLLIVCVTIIIIVCIATFTEDNKGVKKSAYKIVGEFYENHKKIHRTENSNISQYGDKHNVSVTCDATPEEMHKFLMLLLKVLHSSKESIF